MRTLSLLTIAIFSLVAFGQNPDRSKPPALGKAPAFTPGAVQEFQLPNGLKVVLYEKHDLPLVEINLMVQAGTYYEDSPGIATMTADMLDEGAGKYDAFTLAESLEYLGSSLFTFSDDFYINVGVRTTVPQLAETLLLMKDVVLEPSFPDAELERKKAETLANFSQLRDQISVIASEAYKQTVYGKKHPLGRLNSGDAASVSGMTRDDLVAYHSKMFVPENAVLVVVGDIGKDKLLLGLQRVFGDWSGEMPKLTAKLPDTKNRKRKKIILVDKPGAVQSVLVFGAFIPPSGQKDHYAFTVLNTILGGSFTSRLNTNLREKNGYAYGAGSNRSYRPGFGLFSAMSNVQTDVTDKAIFEFFNEFEAIAKPVDQEELERAKNYEIYQFPDQFQTVSDISRAVQYLIRSDLPLDTYQHSIESIRAVTAEDVKAAADDYIVPELMHIVVVGDRSKIEKGLKSLALGKVHVLSVDDVLGPAPSAGNP